MLPAAFCNNNLADATLGIARDAEAPWVRLSAAETACGMPTVFGRRPA
jgi:hypothetical protein